MSMSRVASLGRWPLIALLSTLACALARGESIDSSVQRKVREATFEVVLAKPESDPLSYEKPLPLDLLPYADRVGKYRAVGTAFFIGKGLFVTAAHVMSVGAGNPPGALALRDAAGKVYQLDRVLKFSNVEDYAVFTLVDPPHATALEPHERPPLNDPVYAVGDALGEGIIIRDGLYTSDTPEEREGRWKWIRFSAAASPGNSGGPLIDRKGRVVGVVLRKSPNENLNVAVAIDQVLKGSDQSATVEGRTNYHFPLMRASDLVNTNETFPLPKSIDDFYAALDAALVSEFHKVRDTYRKAHGDRMFPHGTDSEQPLHSLWVADFPRALEERSDGIWGLTDPKPQRSQLDRNGFIETANFPDATTAIRLRIPDETSRQELYGNSKEYMDLVLKGMTLNRQVGTDSVRITSLGSATVDESFEDAYGRTWQVREWPLPHINFIVVSLALPTPEGYVAITALRPQFFASEAVEDLETLTGFFYLSFPGTLRQWQDYLSSSVVKPKAMQSLELHADYGKEFKFRSKRFTLAVPSGLPKIDPESILTLKFSYFHQGDSVVWDLAGLYLGDPQRKSNSLDVIRHQRPLTTFPEAWADQWHKIENGEHPYTGLSYSTNGGTRIDSVQDLKDVSAGHRAVAYTITVIAEGTQDQATMKRALDAARGGLSVLERD
jgi:serine protease Do